MKERSGALHDQDLSFLPLVWFLKLLYTSVNLFYKFYISHVFILHEEFKFLSNFSLLSFSPVFPGIGNPINQYYILAILHAIS